MPTPEPDEAPWRDDRLRQAGRPHARRARRSAGSSLVLEHVASVAHSSSSRFTIGVLGALAHPASTSAKAQARVAPHRSRGARSSSPCSRPSPCSSAASPRSSPSLVVQARPRRRRADAPVPPARARGPRRLHPRGLLQLPLADDPPVRASRRSATARPSTLDATRSSITRSSGAASARDRTSRARAASTRTSGTTGTCIDPRAYHGGSNMPPYAHLADEQRRPHAHGRQAARDADRSACRTRRPRSTRAQADAQGARRGHRQGPRRPRASTSTPDTRDGRAHRLPAAPRQEAAGERSPASTVASDRERSVRSEIRDLLDAAARCWRCRCSRSFLFIAVVRGDVRRHA